MWSSGYGNDLLGRSLKGNDCMRAAFVIKDCRVRLQSPMAILTLDIVFVLERIKSKRLFVRAGDAVDKSS